MEKATVNFFKPYPAQQPVVRACIDKETKYIIYNASRQSGKTLLLHNVAVYYALQNKDNFIMIVSPTDGQVKKIYKQILESIIHLPFVDKFKSQSGDAEINFLNGSTMIFRSAQSFNSLRGYSLTHLLCDEFAFFDEEVYNTVLAPTLAVRGKKALFCSTPKGTNLFYRMYNLGLTEEKYKSFKTTYKDNPYADKDFIEEQKKILSDAQFKQEYLGEFIDSAALFQNIENYSVLNQIESPVQGDSYFAGIDIGFKNDSTVISIFNHKSELVHIKILNQVSFQEQVRIIKETTQKFDVVLTYVESNNQGVAIIDGLIAAGMWKLQSFETTATSKPKIINQFLADFNQGLIKFVNNEQLKQQFKAFGYKMGNNGHVTFGGTGGIHDDIVMATIIGYANLKLNVNSIGGVVFN